MSKIPPYFKKDTALYKRFSLALDTAREAVSPEPLTAEEVYKISAEIERSQYKIPSRRW